MSEYRIYSKGSAQGQFSTLKQAKREAALLFPGLDSKYRIVEVLGERETLAYAKDPR
jgi:predicted membrane-bound spermidine synthase